MSGWVPSNCVPVLVNVTMTDPSKSRKISITSKGCCGDDEGLAEGLLHSEPPMLGRNHVHDHDYMAACIKSLPTVALSQVLLPFLFHCIPASYFSPF